MKIFVDASLFIYLNVRMPEKEAEVIEKFWLNLVLNHMLYTNLLVLDEVIYVSKKKYDVEYEETIKFIDKVVLPYVEILPIGLDEYLIARELMSKYRLKPSDSIHAATIESRGLQAIATEDEDFDKIGIRRVWLT